MSGISGLQPSDRRFARKITTQAALVGLHNAKNLHYTQGHARWSGITRREIGALGEFPPDADCSAFVTWCLWNSLAVVFGLNDIVNDDRWQGGFTGTMATHGREVQHLHNVIRGDAVLYGKQFPYDHTAIVVGHHLVNKASRPLVVSHGSEAGPFLLDYAYRPDVAQIRRYI